MITLVFGESLRAAHDYIKVMGLSLETTLAAFDCRALKGVVEKTSVLLLKYHSFNPHWPEFKARLEALEKENLVRVEFREIR